MNSNQLIASTIANVTWKTEDGKSAHFESTRGYGIRKGDAFLSFNGERPSVWSTKAIAAEIAASIEADAALTWIEVA